MIVIRTENIINLCDLADDAIWPEGFILDQLHKEYCKLMEMPIIYPETQERQLSVERRIEAIQDEAQKLVPGIDFEFEV